MPSCAICEADTGGDCHYCGAHVCEKCIRSCPDCGEDYCSQCYNDAQDKCVYCQEEGEELPGAEEEA